MENRKDESPVLEGLRALGRGLRLVGRSLRAMVRWIMHRLDRTFEHRSVRVAVAQLEKGFEEFIFSSVHQDDLGVICRTANAYPFVRRIIIEPTHKKGRFRVSIREV